MCLFLTGNDGGSDGERRKHLIQPRRWRHYDPELFDRLQRILDVVVPRSVSLAREGSHPSGRGVQSQWLSMSTVEEAQALLSRMTPGEKAQLLQRVAQESRDAYPGIDTIDGVCGGEPVIVRTRIPVWVLEQARRLGSNEADLLRLYPGLRAEDLASAWEYVRSHRDEIDRQIRDNESA